MAIVIPYVKQTWVDNNVSNPLSAARLGVLEEGILDVSQAPAVRVFHNAAQSITSGVTTALAFNSERFDQAGGASSTMHDTVTNNSRLTAQYAGIYWIWGNVDFASNSTGYRQLFIRLNGATEIADEINPAVATTVTRIIVNCPYALAVNDYVELCVVQTSGGALNVSSTGNLSPEFGMVRVG